MTVYSFDGILRQPRKLHAPELWPGGPRVALPRPVPLISLVYLAVVELMIMVVDNVIPFTVAIGAVLSTLAGGSADVASWVLCYVIAPVVIVYFALNAEIDGRAPHRWVVSVVRSLFAPRRTWCGIAVEGEQSRVRYRGRVRVYWDEHAPRLHHGWVLGGRLTTFVPVRFTHALRHRSAVARYDDDGDLVLNYEVLARLEVRP